MTESVSSEAELFDEIPPSPKKPPFSKDQREDSRGLCEEFVDEIDIKSVEEYTDYDSSASMALDDNSSDQMEAETSESGTTGTVESSDEDEPLIKRRFLPCEERAAAAVMSFKQLQRAMNAGQDEKSTIRSRYKPAKSIAEIVEAERQRRQRRSRKLAPTRRAAEAIPPRWVPY